MPESKIDSVRNELKFEISRVESKVKDLDNRLTCKMKEMDKRLDIVERLSVLEAKVSAQRKQPY